MLVVALALSSVAALLNTAQLLHAAPYASASCPRSMLHAAPYASASPRSTIRATAIGAADTPTTATALPSDSSGPTLLSSYEDTIQLLLAEINACAPGDRIFLQLYLLEPGLSSEQVLAALEEAGSRRGVQVTFVLDVSVCCRPAAKRRLA